MLFSCIYFLVFLFLISFSCFSFSYYLFSYIYFVVSILLYPIFLYLFSCIHFQRGNGADFYLRFPEQISLQQIVKRSQRLNANYIYNTSNRIKSNTLISKSKLFYLIFYLLLHLFYSETFKLIQSVILLVTVTIFCIFTSI